MLKVLKALLDCRGKPETRLVDNGYISKDNIWTCVDEKIAPFIALGPENPSSVTGRMPEAGRTEA